VRKEARLDQLHRKQGRGHLLYVQEGGLKFNVNLNEYLDYGLFLDHRITRVGIVKNGSCRQRRAQHVVLDGFFSVYAAEGGAAAVNSVDLSKPITAGATIISGETIITTAKNGSSSDVIAGLDMPKPIVTISWCSTRLPSANSKRDGRFFDIQRDH